MSETDQCPAIRQNILDLNASLPSLRETHRQAYNASQTLPGRIEEARRDLRMLDVAEVLVNGLPAGRAALAIVRRLGASSLSAAKDLQRREMERLARALREAEREVDSLRRQIDQDEANLAPSHAAFDRIGCR